MIPRRKTVRTISWYTPLDNRKLTLREVVLFGMLGALTFAAKVAMSALPNIEPVSLMVMLFAVVFGWKGLYPIYLYVVMEIMYYGIHFWNINYLYVWAILALAAMAMRRLKNPLWWALLSGAFGLAFGLLCSPVYMVTGGSVRYGIAWFLKGIPYDVPHGIGNFAIALVLFVPLRELLSYLYAKMQ